MDDEKNLSLSKPEDRVLDVVSIVTSIVPYIGGPVSAVLSGMSIGRKFDRVQEVLVNMSKKIKDFQSDNTIKYVNTDEFQDLLEATLKQVAEERSEEKRKVYATFLANDVKSPDKPYDEKIRIIRHLQELQEDHLRTCNALMQNPTYNNNLITGSISNTLQRRLPDLDKERIRDLAQQLTDIRMADLSSLNTMMTARGAEDLRSTITPYGKQFIAYITS